MQPVLIAVVALLVGAILGALTAANLTRRRVVDLQDDVDAARARRDQAEEKMRGCDLPLGAIESAVARGANQPTPVVGQVLEVLRALPALAHALGRWPTQPDRCADPAAVRETAGKLARHGF